MSEQHIQEWLKNSYMVKLSGVLKVYGLGGDCRSITVEFASMEQAKDAVQRILEGQLCTNTAQKL